MMKKTLLILVAALVMAGCSDSPPTVTELTAAATGAEAGVEVGTNTDSEDMSSSADPLATGVESVAPETVTEVVTETKTVEATEEPTEELSDEVSHELALVALEMAWNEMGTTGQAQICDGWELGPEVQEVLTDAFLEGSEGMGLDSSDVSAFFNEKC